MSGAKTECIACGGGVGQEHPCVCGVHRTTRERMNAITDKQIDDLARQELYGGDSIDWNEPYNLLVTQAPRAYFRIGFRAALREVQNGG